MKKPKIAFFDIETFPIEAYVWGMYEQNVIKVKKDWELASFAYQYEGEKSIHVKSRRLYSEKDLVKELHKLFQEADILVGHNGNSFDIKKANAKFAEYDLGPAGILSTVDTKLIAKRYCAFSSNSLNELARVLKVGSKLDTGGFQLWEDCMRGDKKAFQKMEKYNKQDVVVLKRVYNKLKKFAFEHPSLSFLATGKKHDGCPDCGSMNYMHRGYRATARSIKRQVQCKEKSCGRWFLLPLEKTKKK